MTATKMRSSFTLLSVLASLLLLPLMASAEPVTITGKLNGYNCVVTGYVCPVDKKDPVAALEADFVLQTGEKYYFLPNLNRDLKAKYFLDEVQVSGDLDKYNGIKVDVFKVKQADGSFKTVWSQQMQNEELKRLFGPPGK